MGCVYSKWKTQEEEIAISPHRVDILFLPKHPQDILQISEGNNELTEIWNIVENNECPSGASGLRTSSCFHQRCNKQKKRVYIEMFTEGASKGEPYKLEIIEPKHFSYHDIQGVSDHLLSFTLHHLNESYFEDLLTTFQIPFPHLESIDFSFNKSVTDGVLEAVFRNCSNLREIFIEHCSPLTADGFMFLYLLKCLKVFRLGSCGVEGDRMISHIGKCKSLKILHITRTSGITTNAVAQCVAQLPLIKTHHVKGTFKIKKYSKDVTKQKMNVFAY